MDLLRLFRADEDGSTPIEYAMLAMLIAVATLTALLALSDSTAALYEQLAAAFPDATQPS